MPLSGRFQMKMSPGCWLKYCQFFIRVIRVPCLLITWVLSQCGIKFLAALDPSFCPGSRQAGTLHGSIKINIALRAKAWMWVIRTPPGLVVPELLAHRYYLVSRHGWLGVW